MRASCAAAAQGRQRLGDAGGSGAA
jgi:hypothetical protein